MLRFHYFNGKENLWFKTKFSVTEDAQYQILSQWLFSFHSFCWAKSGYAAFATRQCSVLDINCPYWLHSTCTDPGDVTMKLHVELGCVLTHIHSYKNIDL